MKKTKLITFLKRAAMTLLLSVVSVTTVWADDWPEYITDVVVFATKKDNRESCIDTWKNKGYIVIEQNLNAGTMNIVTLWQNLGDGWKLILSGTTLAPKMDKAPVNITDSVFSSVTFDKTPQNVQTEYADFIGSYDPVDIAAEDKTLLYMGLDNKLYYPDQAMTINAFRGYFCLQGIEAGNLPSNAIELNFNDETTGLSPIHSLNSEGSSYWYTLDGRKPSGKPTQKGIYINNGKKIIVTKK